MTRFNTPPPARPSRSPKNHINLACQKQNIIQLVTKQDYITYWKTTAEKDWIAVEHLFEKGDYLHSLFFAHLVLEKLMKAHWVKDNQGTVPHLVYLLGQTQLSLPAPFPALLVQMNQFQMSSRYPDYQFLMYKIATKTYTQTVLKQVEQLKTWLEKTLP